MRIPSVISNRLTAALSCFCLLTLTGVLPPLSDETRLDEISLPPGFSISLYAKVPGARSMALGEQGVLFVGTRGSRVYAIMDKDRDGRGETVLTLDDGLESPNGVAVLDGDLYVAEISRVLRYEDIESRLNNPPDPVVINDSFPDDKRHGWKYIAFGPDGLLYVPVGTPCNICDEGDPYAAILRMRPNGTGLEIFARGVRNTVGFDWEPETGVLWFTDNGRDWLGDDRPPDELNRAPGPGLHFGYPYCHGKDLPDPEFGEGKTCSDYTPPELELPAHAAALGMTFYTGAMFPKEYRNRVFIAEHGSWNRSTPIGYRVTMARVENGKATDYSVFAEGWLQGSKAWGRPVDVLQMPDGSLLVSDDRGDAVYRITYGD